MTAEPEKTWRNEAVLQQLSGKNGLLDCNIRRLDICEQNQRVNVNMYVELRQRADFPGAMIQFHDCQEFALDWSSGYNFSLIPQLKFFRNDEGLFYFSAHPWDEMELVSEDDEYVIVSKELSLAKWNPDIA